MIEITEAAVEQIKSVLQEENNPNIKLRMFVHGGGCSGFQYGFTVDEEIADDDIVIEKSDIKVLVDSLSAQYLQGAIIDFRKSFMQSQFVIENPNVQSTCGCGSSFSV